MLEWVAQAGILVFGLSAHFFNQARDGTRRRFWSPFLGLTAQVFWVMLALSAGAYGLLVLVALYGAGWVHGCVRELGGTRAPVWARFVRLWWRLRVRKMPVGEAIRFGRYRDE